MPAAIDVKTRTKIRVLRESGLSLRQIVKQAGVCKSTVQKVITEENLQKGILIDSLRKSSAHDSAHDSAQNIQSEHRVTTQAAQTAACTVAELANQRAQERIDEQQELKTQRTCALIDIEAEMEYQAQECDALRKLASISLAVMASGSLLSVEAVKSYPEEEARALKLKSSVIKDVINTRLKLLQHRARLAGLYSRKEQVDDPFDIDFIAAAKAGGVEFEDQ